MLLEIIYDTSLSQLHEKDFRETLIYFYSANLFVPFEKLVEKLLTSFKRYAI